MLVSVDEVQLIATTMTCILSAGMWRKLGESLMVFSLKKLPLWNTIIIGYVQRGLFEEAIDLYCLRKTINLLRNFFYLHFVH